MTTICDASGNKVLDIANLGGTLAIGVHGSELVACIDVDDLFEALQSVGFLMWDGAAIYTGRGDENESN